MARYMVNGLRGLAKKNTLAGLVIASLVWTMTACVNPKTDYDNYVNSTSSLRPKGGDAGASTYCVADSLDAGVDAALLPAEFVAPASLSNAYYWGACLTSQSSTSAESLQVQLNLTVEPATLGDAGDDDAGQVVNAILTPLAVRTTANEAVVTLPTDLSQTVGPPLPATGTMLSNGTVTMPFGSVTLSALADAILPAPIIATNVTFSGGFLADGRLIGQLTGNTSQPIPLDLGAPPFTPCFFIPYPGPSGAIPSPPPPAYFKIFCASASADAGSDASTDGGS